MGGNREEAQLFQEVHTERRRRKGHKVQQGKFQEDMKEKLFPT